MTLAGHMAPTPASFVVATNPDALVGVYGVLIENHVAERTHPFPVDRASAVLAKVADLPVEIYLADDRGVGVGCAILIGAGMAGFCVALGDLGFWDRINLIEVGTLIRGDFLDFIFGFHFIC